MITTLNAIAPIFLIILIGYFLYRSAIIGEQVWSAIEHLCFYLLFPFLIVRTLSRANLGSVPVVDFTLVIVVAILGMSIALIFAYSLLRKQYPASGPSFTSVFQGATRFHGFVALAIIGPLYGDDGVTLTAIALAIMVPLLNTISVIVLSVYGHGASSIEPTNILKQIIKNPLIIACVAGLILNRTGIPDIAFNAIEIIGNGGLGLALLAVGAGMRPGQAARDKLLIFVGVFIRLIGMPAIVIFMAWIVGLEGLPRTIAIIAGAVPTAASSYVMARKMGGNAELMSNIVTFQIIASFITLPFFIYLSDNLTRYL
ncbi:MAG: AEC family transporter [Gammaproteobacteria bacterium]|nr:AEC family transporter [Gammaproteobacteria bacterium]